MKSTSKTDGSLQDCLIGFSPSRFLRTALIVCDAFNARTVTKQIITAYSYRTRVAKPFFCKMLIARFILNEMYWRICRFARIYGKVSVLLFILQRRYLACFLCKRRLSLRHSEFIQYHL